MNLKLIDVIDMYYMLLYRLDVLLISLHYQNKWIDKYMEGQLKNKG